MRFAVAALATVIASVPAAADQATPGKLAGHAIVPALSFFNPPADAPADLAMSGKFTNADKKRIDTTDSVMGTSFLSEKAAPRETGIKLPFKGQPMQGFSGLKSLGNGVFMVLQDNGFGSKANSADAMLVLHKIKPDWNSGKVEIHETIFLHDPDKKIPFQIALEGTAKRYLTGADLDVESFQTIGDQIWIGDEFGPYLIRADMTGKVNAFVETQVDGKPARSPDHYLVSTPAVPGGAVAFNVRRSRGYEAMAASKDGKFLYPLLEGPLWDEAAKAWEMDGGNEYLRILEFDVAAQKWTGRHWKYKLEINGNNIGDFNMIDATTGLIIERDNGEGEQWQGCTARREARLLQRAGQAQAHLQDRDDRRQCRLVRAQDRASRSARDQGPGQEGEAGQQGRRLHLPLRHHRRPRSGRRPPHHRRQRQQPAVFVGPRARQAGRQRADPGRGVGPSESQEYEVM